MKNSFARIFESHESEVLYRTDRRHATFGVPQLSQSPVVYELSGQAQAIAHGGVPLLHQISIRSGLYDSLQKVPVLKLHLPYNEADHLLNISYNFFCGGTALEHIDYRRCDPAYLNSLGAHSIPDPTTAGDFCRRYNIDQINQLQEEINNVRLGIWSQQPASFFREAVVDLDGTLAFTRGECKAGMNISYKGEWGYHPLIVSLSNTGEILYVMNRSGNRPSHEGAHEYIDKTISMLYKAGFQTIVLRGDTDFSQTAYLDGWDSLGVQFVFGLDSMSNLETRAEELETTAWNRLDRASSYEVKTVTRGLRPNIKEQIVRERGYRNYVLEQEDVAEIDYRPSKCSRPYRVVILRKTIHVKEGQKLLFPEIRYFFYITNIRTKTLQEIVFEANQRCNQENLIGQLKSGMKALRMPLNTLESNWVYLLCGCLAWTLKSWAVLLSVTDFNNRDEAERKNRLLRMEFATFLQAMVTIPAQVIRSGRQIILRFLNMNSWTTTFFRLYESLRQRRILRE